MVSELLQVVLYPKSYPDQSNSQIRIFVQVMFSFTNTFHRQVDRTENLYDNGVEVELCPRKHRKNSIGNGFCKMFGMRNLTSTGCENTKNSTRIIDVGGKQKKMLIPEKHSFCCVYLITKRAFQFNCFFRDVFDLPST